MGLDAILGDHHDFAVFDFADECGADDVEGAGFRTQDVAAVEPAENEWTNAQGIARANELLVGEADQGIGALKLADGLDETFGELGSLRTSDEMKDDFRIGCRLADGTL